MVVETGLCLLPMFWTWRGNCSVLFVALISTVQGGGTNEWGHSASCFEYILFICWLERSHRSSLSKWKLEISEYFRIKHDMLKCPSKQISLAMKQTRWLSWSFILHHILVDGVYLGYFDDVRNVQVCSNRGEAFSNQVRLICLLPVKTNVRDFHKQTRKLDTHFSSIMVSLLSLK